uniref:Transmembrane protease serine 12-like n=1 Tax=Pogona vitticeps TaxID=103695 RepID=A0A6J0SZ84_9SAUR
MAGQKMRTGCDSFWALLMLLSHAHSAIPTDECGTRPAVEDITGTQVVGGHNVQLGAWPWQVSLQIYRVGSGRYLHECGGSLINNNSVLTAAHCIKKWINPEYWRAVLGLHHLYKWNSHTMYRRVKKIVIHPDFKWGSYENDIAFFQLLRFVKYNEYIQPICLPDIAHLVTDMDLCYISGWGKREKKDKFQNTLQETKVDIIPLYICNRFDWFNGRISRNMICAGSASGHGDSCEGDSGGPLMCNFPNVSEYYLIGITSSATACGIPKHPGIYLNTVHYRTWIDSQLYSKTTTSIQHIVIFFIMEWVIFYVLL